MFIIYLCLVLLFFFPIIYFFPHEVTISITYCTRVRLKYIDINCLINALSFLILVITLSLPSWCYEFSSFYLSSSFLLFMAFVFSIEPSQLVRDILSLSLCEVSLVSVLSSFASFLNDLNPRGNEGRYGSRSSSR